MERVKEDEGGRCTLYTCMNIKPDEIVLRRRDG
jgi:hypothetical protein